MQAYYQKPLCISNMGISIAPMLWCFVALIVLMPYMFQARDNSFYTEILYSSPSISAEEVLEHLRLKRGVNHTIEITELQKILSGTTVEPIASVNELEKKMLLIVHMFSNPGYVRDGYKARKMHFYAYQSDHSVLAVVPREEFANVLTQYTKTEMPPDLEDIYFKLTETRNLVTYGPLLRYIDDGTEIFFQGIIAEPPDWYLKQLKGKKRPHIFCHHKGWSLRYALFSGAVFSYHIIHLPILYKYEYMLKVDADIHFHKPIIDLGKFFRRKGQKCVVAHSMFQTANDCEKEVPLSLKRFVQAYPDISEPKSITQPWCNSGGKIQKKFYGNFVAYSTEKLLLDETIQRLSVYLYHNFSQGYFSYRWGDQAPPIGFLCMIYDIKDIANDYRICDISYLREEDYFSHK